MVTKTKFCARHQKEEPATEFPKDKKQHDRLSTWCKTAWREYRAEKAGGKVTKKVTKPAAKKPVAKSAAKKTAAKSGKASKEAG